MNKAPYFLELCTDKSIWSDCGIKLKGKGIKEENSSIIIKAATAFILGERWYDASDLYLKASDLTPHHDAKALFHIKSADLIMKVGNKSKAIELYKGAVSNFCEARMFHQAAVIQYKVAELLENEEFTEEASASYEKAAALYRVECIESQAILCSLKSAYISKNHCYVYSTFEKVAQWYQLNNIEEFRTPEIYLCMGLAMLVNEESVDEEIFTRKFKEIQKQDPIFATSKESSFLEKLGDIKYNTRESSDPVNELIDQIFFFDCVKDGGNLDCWKLIKLKELKALLEYSHQFGSHK